jgi:2-amino-4-hydroxy-6-hydroxymethyldihydropteridine diphosphokinase
METGLSIGSNLGNRLVNLRVARDRIAATAGIRVMAQSPVYETSPVGVKPEHEHLKFLNAVLILETEMSSSALHRELSRIEDSLGRERSVDRFAPRTVDIDILFAGGEMIDRAGLTIPHPRWSQRRFVLQPLADVRPDLVLPGAARTVRETLAALPAGENVALFAADW